MKNTFKRSMFGLLLVAASSPAVFAAETAELKVTGRITGPACDVQVGSGTVDYGDITVASLNTDLAKDTVLATKKIDNDIVITCNADTSISMAFTDNRVTSAGGNVGAVETLSEAVAAGAGGGLGFDSAGNKVGGYDASLMAALVDDVPRTLYPIDGNGVVNGGIAGVIAADGDTEFGFADSQGVAAVGQLFRVQYWVKAHIAPRSALDLSRPIELDGSVALQVNYL